MSILTYVAVVFLVLVLLLYRYVRIPNNMPKNIPSVPIYISLIGLWSSMGQDEIYDRWLRGPLEKYGAVKIWFAGRWSILVTRPDLLTDMMRNEDIYAKAGSQKKIPWSVISSLVGDNIINSHGDDWKLYTSVMKPGMQKTSFDSRPLLDKSRIFVTMLLKDQEKSSQSGSGSVTVNGLIQRFAIAAMGESFLDIDFKVSSQPTNCSRKDLLRCDGSAWKIPACGSRFCRPLLKRRYLNLCFSTFPGWICTQGSFPPENAHSPS